MSTDRMTEETDWKDGMNAYREKSYKEFTEIYHSLAKIEEEINKIKQQIKGETP